MEQFRQKSAGMLDRPARQMARRLDETDHIVGTLRTISGAWTQRTVADPGIPPAYRNRASRKSGRDPDDIPGPAGPRGNRRASAATRWPCSQEEKLWISTVTSHGGITDRPGSRAGAGGDGVLIMALLALLAILSAAVWLAGHLMVAAGVALLIAGAIYLGRRHERSRAVSPRPGQGRAVAPLPAAAGAVPADTPPLGWLPGRPGRITAAARPASEGQQGQAAR